MFLEIQWVIEECALLGLGKNSDVDPVGERNLRLIAHTVGVEFIGLHIHGHRVGAVRILLRCARCDFIAVERNLLEQIRHQSLQRVGRVLAENRE